jgi:hypothetical protein
LGFELVMFGGSCFSCLAAGVARIARSVIGAVFAIPLIVSMARCRVAADRGENVVNSSSRLVTNLDGRRKRQVVLGDLQLTGLSVPASVTLDIVVVPRT